MPFVDVLRGLKALFLESPEATSRADLLAARAPGLSAEERRALDAIPAERLDVYVGMLRENQASMLDFVAPDTVGAAEELAGVSRAALARATLVETPRRSARLRELSERLVDHLRGAGRAIVERCPAILDLARLERAQTESFYAAEDDDAWTPAAFGERAAAATVDEVLAFEVSIAPSVRVVSVEHDVLAWRERRHGSGTWAPPPDRLAAPLEVLVARDPESLQPSSLRLAPALLALVRPPVESTPAEARGRTTLEALAERWIEASGTSPDDPDAAARFFEQAADWVRHGVLVAYGPAPDRTPTA